LLDELLILDIYPAREVPIEGITSQFLLDKISLDRKWLVPAGELLKQIESLDPEVLLTMGAGDIDQFAGPISNLKKHFRS
jgi:UDP-N-acetylmuramate--alanine ligase